MILNFKEEYSRKVVYKETVKSSLFDKMLIVQQFNVLRTFC